MERSRLPMLMGSLISVMASLALVAFGPAVVRVLGVAGWTFREGTGPPPELEHLADLRPAALYALLFGLATVQVSLGLCVVAKAHAATPAGRALWAVAGSVSILGAAAIMYGVSGAQRVLNHMAASTVVTTGAIQGHVSESVPPVVCGFAALLLSQVLLIVAGTVGLERRSPPSGCTMRIRIAGGVAAASALAFAALFMANWIAHGRAIESAMADMQIVNPSVLARHLMGIMGNAQLAGACLVIYGVSLVVVGCLLPGRERPGGHSAATLDPAGPTCY